VRFSGSEITKDAADCVRQAAALPPASNATD
jgi:hypothetical protein